MRIEKEGGQQEHAECILPSVPVAGLNESQEKGDGPPGPFQLTKTAAQDPGAGACLKDREGEKARRREERERRRREVQSPGPVHLYGLRPEFGLVWGGRGATCAGGQTLVSEEKESGEEREWQDEADKGQCVHAVFT